MQRKREKGRDFYDVNFLYGMAQPDFIYLEKNLKIKRKELAEKIIKKCEKLDFQLLAKDVEPFLIDPEQSARVSQFLDFIKKKLS